MQPILTFPMKRFFALSTLSICMSSAYAAQATSYTESQSSTGPLSLEVSYPSPVIMISSTNPQDITMMGSSITLAQVGPLAKDHNPSVIVSDERKISLNATEGDISANFNMGDPKASSFNVQHGSTLELVAEKGSIKVNRSGGANVLFGAFDPEEGGPNNTAIINLRADSISLSSNAQVFANLVTVYKVDPNTNKEVRLNRVLPANINVRATHDNSFTSNLLMTGQAVSLSDGGNFLAESMQGSNLIGVNATPVDPGKTAVGVGVQGTAVFELRATQGKNVITVKGSDNTASTIGLKTANGGRISLLAQQNEVSSERGAAVETYGTDGISVIATQGNNILVGASIGTSTAAVVNAYQDPQKAPTPGTVLIQAQQGKNLISSTLDGVPGVVAFNRTVVIDGKNGNEITSANGVYAANPTGILRILGETKITANNGYGMFAEDGGSINVDKALTINSSNGLGIKSSAADNEAPSAISLQGNVTITSNKTGIIASKGSVLANGQTTVTAATEGAIKADKKAIVTIGDDTSTASHQITANAGTAIDNNDAKVTINGNTATITATADQGIVTATGTTTINAATTLHSGKAGITTATNGQVVINKADALHSITADAEAAINVNTGSVKMMGSTATITASDGQGIVANNGQATINAVTTLAAKQVAIDATNKAQVTLGEANATGAQSITSTEGNAIHANDASVTVNGASALINSAKAAGIVAEGGKVEVNAATILHAGNGGISTTNKAEVAIQKAGQKQSIIANAGDAINVNTGSVTVTGSEATISATQGKAIVANAGQVTVSGQSALNAQMGIDASGNQTLVTLKDGVTTLEATGNDAVKAATGATVAIAQFDKLSATQTAIRAGRVVKADPLQASMDDLLKDQAATVTAQYGPTATLAGALLADAGTITVKDADGVTGSKVIHTVNQGAAMMAANGGTLNYTLANDSTVTGYAYNFMDLGTATQAASESTAQATLKPANAGTNPIAKTTGYLSSPDLFAVKAGTINLTLNDASKWAMTQQSAISTLGGSGTVSLSQANNHGNAVHIGKLDGGNTFEVHLEKRENAQQSDVIYIKEGKAGQSLVITNQDELFASMKPGDYVRVATISTSTKQEFGEDGKVYADSVKGLVKTKIVGKYSQNSIALDKDVAYNEAYNGTEWNDKKPGNDFVKAYYGDPEAVTNYYLYCLEDLTTPTPSVGARVLPQVHESVYGLIASLDTLNKRQGEIRYDDSNKGFWGRIIHDRLKKSDRYKLTGTAFELGYDFMGHQASQNVFGSSHGLFVHWGSYDPTLTGFTKQDSSLKVLALGAHSTYRYENGNYFDLVARIGRITSKYSVGEQATTGRYRNTYFQVSAEVGHQFKHNAWFVEPQAQLQFTHVRRAQYTDSDGMNVSVGAINSLIGRLGGRVARKMSDVRDEFGYAYANIEHEFKGNVKTTAIDGALQLAHQSGNRATWYTLGLGYSRPFGKDFFMSGNVEKRVGGGYNGWRFDVSAKYKF